MDLRMQLLGPIEVFGDGKRLDVRGDRQRALLAFLALTPGAIRPMERIIDALWRSDDGPHDPRQAVHTYASRLRAIMGSEHIVALGGGYQLVVEPMQVDTVRFETLLRGAKEPGRTVDHRLSALTEATGLWRGRALEGFSGAEWAQPEAVRLDELRCEAEDLLALTRLEAGRGADAIADIEAAAMRNPFRESTHRLLMSCLHQVGRQVDALRVFQAYRRRLATDLGLEPGDAIVTLDREIASGGAVPSPHAGHVPGARGYRLVERIGDGAFAVVYRGAQPSVDREVAIKVIREELANRPEFIRRFEAEAHLVAHLEHPHIVPLYDYWREPGSAWLVMRLFRDGTLEHRIDQGPLSLDETIRVAIQMGAALDTAHRAGVVHRDVKPANVFLDPQGNNFLGDFGIAREAAGPQLALDPPTAGSPAYASPEQLRREPVGPPADIHALAVTIFQCLSGHLPFRSATSDDDLLHRQLNDPMPAVSLLRPGLPRAVDDVLLRATAKDPADRYATVTEFVAEFTSAAQGRPTLHPPPEPARRIGGVFRNPFKGLLAFQEADSPDFFGRTRVVDRIVERLASTAGTERLIALVGPSGAGKSSVIRAGLLPALRRGAVAGSQHWFITTMLPGAQPFDELEAALARVAGAPVGGLADLMAADRRGIGRAIKQVLPEESSELLLVIDQFEEIFTLCGDVALRQQFLAGLAAAVGDAHSRVRVVVTMRADFYDRPLGQPEIADAFERGAIALTPLAPEELEQVITEPAFRSGATFEGGLVARIVADVFDQPGALPLLQYALTELFERHTDGVLTKEAYDKLGGLTGALARRAEELFVASPPAAQAVTRRFFTRLVTPGEGTSDTRRRVLMVELGHGPEIEPLVGTYGAARLLSFDRDPASRAPTVEVAHEALLHGWPRLRSWLDDDRDGLRLHRHLTAAAAAWEASDRDTGELYRGGRLEAAAVWAASHQPDLNLVERAFLDTSEQAHREEIEREARIRRRLRRMLATVGCVAVLALIAGSLAVVAERRADRNRQAATAAAAEADAQRATANAAALEADAQRATAEASAAEAATQRTAAQETAADAETGRMAAVAGNLIETDQSLALLVAAEANHRSDDVRTQGALQQVLFSMGPILGFARTPEPIRTAGFDAAGNIVAISRPSTVRIIDGKSMTELRTFEMPEDLAPETGSFWNSVVIGGDHLTWIGVSGDLWTAEIATGASKRLGNEHGVSGAAIDPRSGRVGVVGPRGEVSLYDSVDADRPTWTVAGDGWTTIADVVHAAGAPDPVLPAGNDAATTPVPSSVTFDHDGTRLFVSRGEGLRVIDTSSGEQLRMVPWVTPSSFAGQVVAPLADGTGRLAVMSYYHLAIIDPAIGTVTELDTTDFGPQGIDVLYTLTVTDDHRLAIGRTSGYLAVVSDTGAVEMPPTQAQVGRTAGTLLAPDGSLIVVGDGGLVRLRLDGSTLTSRTMSVPARTFGVVALHDAVDVTATQYDAEMRPIGMSVMTCDWAASDCAVDPSASSEWLRSYAQPNGDLAYEINFKDDTRLRIFDPTNEQDPPIELKVRPGTWRVFVPNHRRWAAVVPFLDHEFDVYDLATGERIATLPKNQFVWLNGPPDGRYLLILDTQGDSTYVDTTAWTVSESPLEAGGWLDSAFSPDGRLALTLGNDGAIVLRDADTLKPIRNFSGSVAAGASWMAFSDDSRHALIAGSGRAQVWDVATGVALGNPNGSAAPTAAFSVVEGQVPTLALVTGDQLVLTRFDVEAWPDMACQAAGRNMTLDEWERYGPTGEPYHPTCTQWPSADA